MALGAGLVGLLLRCCWRAAAQLGAPDLKAGVWGRLAVKAALSCLLFWALTEEWLCPPGASQAGGEGQDSAFSRLCWVHITLAQLSLARQDTGTPQKCFCAPEQTVLRAAMGSGNVWMLCLQGIAGEAAFVLVGLLSWSGSTG